MLDEKKRELLKAWSGRRGPDGVVTWTWDELGNAFDAAWGAVLVLLILAAMAGLAWLRWRMADAAAGALGLVDLFYLLMTLDCYESATKGRRERLRRERESMVREVLET